MKNNKGQSFLPFLLLGLVAISLILFAGASTLYCDNRGNINNNLYSICADEITECMEFCLNINCDFRYKYRPDECWCYNEKETRRVW